MYQMVYSIWCNHCQQIHNCVYGGKFYPPNKFLSHLSDCLLHICVRFTRFASFLDQSTRRQPRNLVSQKSFQGVVVLSSEISPPAKFYFCFRKTKTITAPIPSFDCSLLYLLEEKDSICEMIASLFVIGLPVLL